MATSPDRKNKRLSQYNRDDLTRFARKQIASTADATELDAAYERAAQAVHDALVEKYPQKDMKVLQRYDAASADACIYVSSGYYNYDQFCFRDDDKRIPLRPGRAGGCNSRNAFMLEGDRLEAWEAYKDAQAAHDAEIKRRLSDFTALINGAKTFNEVADVWPAAEVMRESIVGSGTSLTVLSDDVVSRIKADPAAVSAEPLAA
jgi:hypothetical protein